MNGGGGDTLTSSAWPVPQAASSGAAADQSDALQTLKGWAGCPVELAVVRPLNPGTDPLNLAPSDT